MKRLLTKTLQSNHELFNKQMEQETKKKLGIDKLHLPIIDPDISLDDFYKYFDPIVDENGNPIEIKDHQREVWNHQYEYVRRAYPKSQKIYFSTTFILEDIKHALTDAMGYEIIICAQSDDHAKTHLSDFKKYILTSEFKDYLITSPIREIGLERNEITKADRAYLHNPKRPFWPTRVYALGFTEGKLVSYKRVKHVHASDITKADSKPENQDKAFASLTSRLANTQGSFVLEAPPRGQHGPLFKQHEKFNSMTEKGIDLSTMPFQEQQKYPFFVKPYDYTVGIKYGCFTPETIEGEKLIHGILFDMYYGAKFMDSDVSFYTSDMFKTSDIVTEFFGDAMSEEQ